MPSCYAVESDIGPLAWRCNRPAGHEGAHQSIQGITIAYAWLDEKE